MSTATARPTSMSRMPSGPCAPFTRPPYATLAAPGNAAPLGLAGPGAHGVWQDRGVAFDELDQRIVGALVENARATPAALGWTTEAYVELFCRGRTSPADIGAAVSKYPEVTGAATITGEADALLHIRAADVRHFERVVERISAEPFVVRTRSVIVLSRLVSRAGIMPSGAGGPSEPDVPGDLLRNGDSG